MSVGVLSSRGPDLGWVRRGVSCGVPALASIGNRRREPGRFVADVGERKGATEDVTRRCWSLRGVLPGQGPEYAGEYASEYAAVG